MIRKRFITLGLIAIVLFAIYPTSVSASVQEPNNIAIQPFWTNVNNVTVSLSFSGTTANCYASIGALSGTSSISGTMKLERKNANGTYTEVKSWSVSSSNQTLIATQTQSVTSGYTYRLTITADATRNGTTENVSNWSEKAL